MITYKSENLEGPNSLQQGLMDLSVGVLFRGIKSRCFISPRCPEEISSKYHKECALFVSRMFIALIRH